MRRLAAIGAGLLALIVLGLAQLVLPGLAAQRLRDRLARSGQVQSVHVSAFPAIELLWHQADRVVVRLGSYHSTPQGLAGLLAQAGDVGSLDASVGTLNTGLLTLRDASLRKRGAQLTGRALVTESDLRAALPVLDSVTPIASAGGRLILQGTATLLGVTASVQTVLAPRDGSLIVAPNVPLGGLATISVFSDPRVRVQSISAAPAAQGFTVTATGRLS